MDDYLALWSAWADGPIDKNKELWGWPVWYWARLGTILQVVAIIGFVLELVGFERLRSHAMAMRDAWVFRWIRRYDEMQQQKQREMREKRSLLNHVRRMRAEYQLSYISIIAGVVLGFTLGGILVGLVAVPAYTALVVMDPESIPFFLRPEPDGPVARALLYLQGVEWFVTLSFWVLGLILLAMFLYLLYLLYILLVQLLLLPFRFIHAFSGILALRRLKLILNMSILLITAFNIHFTLLTQ
jgi:hypothetical protein